MTRVMKHLSSHLSVLVLLPCVLLSAVMTYDIYHSYQKMQNAYATEYNAFMSHGILKLVHEVQKERGITAGYLGSQGKKFTSQLKTQRQTLDKTYQALLIERKNWALSKKVETEFEQFIDKLTKLKDVRTQVDSLSIKPANAIDFYTKINKSGLHNVIIASKYSDNVLIASELFATYNFAAAKEYAGIERAVLSNVLANGTFTDASRFKHIELITKQAISLEEVIRSSTTRNIRAIFKYSQFTCQ